MAITLKTINAELVRLGHQGTLERGNGYFYFRDGEVVDWLDRTVNVPTLNSLSLEQWVEEFRKLKEKNHAIVQSAKGSINKRDFKKDLDDREPPANHPLKKPERKPKGSAKKR
jgi:hypothetical protein